MAISSAQNVLPSENFFPTLLSLLSICSNISLVRLNPVTSLPALLPSMLRSSKTYSTFSLFHSTSVQFSSVAQLCLTLCDPMNRSTPRLPVHHQLPDFTQTHVYRVSDAIQPSHPLSFPFPPAPNPSQHQGLFQ